ncbi:cupin domain-containing protein [Halalkalicoccus sp. NIPERK01]|uniref:cupin domain-containing protein n=1 Tax=Halalkalicoccus sp. NIPERK01 TaxID=3053469 RepID=UPI00256ECA23|nr:cupin domain-containing protein [Halalkalicoccus sp. NIPERK01]MDL5360722.1 cupin domain-containing protein [Halalkalicoccus sp. NIPERK01]
MPDTYTKANYADVDPVAGSLYFLRDPLDCENLGVSVLECDPGWTGKEHDHADEGHEEVYLLVEGEATVVIEDEEVAMAEGDAVRIPGEATRRIENGDAESRFVLVGAP